MQLGQTFNTPEVLGKLKSDGTRYKKSDKQMGKIGGGHMLGRFTTATPQISASGKSVAIVANEPYAARQHKRRPWAWTEHIAEWMTKTAVIEVAAYLNRKAKARRAV